MLARGERTRDPIHRNRGVKSQPAPVKNVPQVITRCTRVLPLKMQLVEDAQKVEDAGM